MLIKSTWNAIIIDDEFTDRQLLQNLLLHRCPRVKIIGEAATVDEAVNLIQRTDPDVIFLDIILKIGTGFDILHQAKDFKGKVIFTTGYDEFAVKAFRYNALDYLLKPINPDDLVTAVQKLDNFQQFSHMALHTLLEALPQKKFEKILIPDGDTCHVVYLSDLVRLEGEGNYTTMYRKTKERITSARPLKFYEDLLPESNFLRIHQSHMINLTCVDKILRGDDQMVQMQDGSTVPIARRRREVLVEAMADSKNFGLL